MIREKISGAFNFENVVVEFVDQFELTETGKFRFVYSVDDFKAYDNTAIVEPGGLG